MSRNRAGAARSGRSVASCEALETRALFNAVPVGPEVLASATAAGEQRFPVVASDATGAFVVAWRSGDPYYGGEIWARLFDANGQPRGDDFRVDSPTGFAGYPPAVAMDDSGDFVVAWVELPDKTSTDSSVYFRRYDADGTPKGPEMLAGRGSLPDVAMTPNGAFDLVFRTGTLYTQRAGFFLQQYTVGGGLSGTAVFGGNLPFSSSTGMAKVAVDDAGKATVAWFENTGTAFVFYQRYANGNWSSPATVFEGGPQAHSELRLAENGDGDMVFLGTTTQGLYARVFDQDGRPHGGPTFVGELNEGGLVFGDAVVADDGSFTVAYAGDRGLKTRGRCFDADGRALGDEFVVSNRGASSSVAPTPGGGFVAALTGPSSTPIPEGSDVYARRMAAVARPDDGFDRAYVRGTGWTNDYLAHLDADGVGLSRFGYVAGGTPDPLPLPFVNLNQVSLGFTRDVDVERDDLSVSGVRHASYPFSGFAYDDARHVATWTFADNLPADRLTLTLDAPGLQHVLHLNVVPGDADRSGRTNSVDLATVRRRQGSSPLSTIGYGAYLRIMDLNGDGRINAIDLASVRRGLNDSLPPASALLR